MSQSPVAATFQTPLEPSATLRGTLMVSAAAVLWGTFSVYFRSAERIAQARGITLGAATEAFVFFSAVLVVLLPRALSRRPKASPTKAAFFWLAFFSVGDAFNVLAYFAAMQKTSVAVAVLTHYTAPLFVALLSPWLLREKRPKNLFVSLFIALAGLVLLMEPHRGESAQSLPGALLGATSGLLFAGAMMSMKRLGTWFSSEQILVFHYPGALVVLFLFIPSGELTHLTPEIWMRLILAGLLPGVLGGMLFVEGIRHLAASRASILALLEPVTAVLLGSLMWDETPGFVAFFGAILVLYAAYRVVRVPVVAQG